MACTGGKGSFKCLTGKYERYKANLHTQMQGCRWDSSQDGSVAGACEHHKEPLGAHTMQEGAAINFLKRGSIQWCQLLK